MKAILSHCKMMDSVHLIGDHRWLLIHSKNTECGNTNFKNRFFWHKLNKARTKIQIISRKYFATKFVSRKGALSIVLPFKSNYNLIRATGNNRLVYLTRRDI